MKTRRYASLLGLALGLTLAAPAALAESFVGKLNGHGCAHEGKTCPVDRLDPHIALERDFVLQKSNGDYMFLPNVPRTVKVRYVLSDVEVIGELNTKYQTVDAAELHVTSGGSKRLVWSQARQDEEFERLYQEGRFPVID